MGITVNIYYTGQNGSARAFAREMLESCLVDRIRAEEGNLRYAYFFPIEDPETLLLIDSWTDQAAIDQHHATPMMEEIARLREKHNLHMRVERYVEDEAGMPEQDAAFVRN